MSASQLIDHINQSIANAEKGISRITPEILSMDGMSGNMTRHFYNNLVSFPGARYLEIGTWKGSSVCSAMCDNSASVVCIDNWSEFGGPKAEFLVNFNKYKGANNAVFIENDCYKVNVSELPKFNIYMYDGNHTKDSHYKALVHYFDCLDDTFIYLVDDWDWIDVRNGTRDAIRALNFKVLYEKEIRVTNDGAPYSHSLSKATWWNGIYIVVLQKQ